PSTFLISSPSSPVYDETPPRLRRRIRSILFDSLFSSRRMFRSSPQLQSIRGGAEHVGYLPQQVDDFYRTSNAIECVHADRAVIEKYLTVEFGDLVWLP